MIATHQRPRTARPWRGEPASYLRWGVRNPDGRESWRLYQVPDLDDASAAHLGLNVVGPVLDVSGLSGRERWALSCYSLEKTHQEEAIAILTRLPRLTTPGIDLDVPADYRGSARAVQHEEEIARWLKRLLPVVLRDTYSSGRRGFGRHLEWRRLSEGDPQALLRVLAWLEQILERGGARRERGSVWRLPGRELVTIDLTRLRHSSGTRQGLFRPLGGLYKDAEHRKTLAPSSPPQGGVLDVSLLPPSPVEDPRPRRRQKRHAPPKDLPPETCELPKLAEWVHEHAKPGERHVLWLELSGALLISGLVSAHQAIRAMQKGGGETQDPRDAWNSTAQRVTQGLPVSAGAALRRRLGSLAVKALARALWQDLRKRGSRIRAREVLRRFGVPMRDLWSQPSQELERRAMGAVGGEQAKLLQLSKTLRSVAWCGARQKQQEECRTCTLDGPRIRLHCGVWALCAACLHRELELKLEAWQLPDEVWIGKRVFPDRKAADKFWRKLPAHPGAPDWSTRPEVRFQGPDGKGGWQVLGIDTREKWAGKRRWEAKRVDVHRARDEVTWLFYTRHAWCRDALEGQGEGAAVFLDRWQALYRSPAVYNNRDYCTVRWPSRKEASEAMREKLQRQEEEKPPDQREEYCACPDEASPMRKRKYRLLDEHGRVLREGLGKPPTLIDVVEWEQAGLLPRASARTRIRMRRWRRGRRRE